MYRHVIKMKMKKNIYITIIIISLSILNCGIRAQVTIGSEISHNPLSVLDIKESTSNPNNSNSKRGIALPRMKLTDKEKLYPMFETSPGSNISTPDYSGSGKTQQDALHTGLVIYNLNKCDGFGRGTYVWNGNEWNPLADVKTIMQPPGIDINMPESQWLDNNNTLLIHLPSGRDLRTFPSDNKFSLTFNWTDPADGPLTHSPAVDLLYTTPGSDGGLKFLNGTHPDNWADPVTVSPVTFDIEIKDMWDIIVTDNVSDPMGTGLANPHRSRETYTIFKVPENECYPEREIKVRLNQTNYRMAISKDNWAFNYLGYRMRNTTPSFPSTNKVHYHRLLITDSYYIGSFLMDHFEFSEHSNARWKSNYTTTTSGIITNIRVPSEGGQEIIDGREPPKQNRKPLYLATATTNATRYKEAGILTYTDTATVQRYPPSEMHIIQCRSSNYEGTNIVDVGYDPTGTNTTGWAGKVLRHQDREGNYFLSAEFGSAGRWMTTNLAVLSYDTQSPNSGDPLTPFTPKTLGDHSNGRKEYAYPVANVTETVPEDLTIDWGTRPVEWRWEEGIYYNWYAATGRVYNLLDNTQEANTDQQIQGICPNGWYLPSDKEWADLEKEIYGNIGKYDIYDYIDVQHFGTPAWNPAWDNASMTFRGDAIDENHVGHGGAMKDPCPPLGNDHAWMVSSMGYSKEPYLGGFNGILVGKIAGDVQGNSWSGLRQRDRAWNTQYWSCSQSNAQAAWLRSLEIRQGGVERSGWNKTLLVSVRCKKKP